MATVIVSMILGWAAFGGLVGHLAVQRWRQRRALRRAAWALQRMAAEEMDMAIRVRQEARIAAMLGQVPGPVCVLTSKRPAEYAASGGRPDPVPGAADPRAPRPPR